MVFTEAYHLKRGHCCENGCRHCPYGFEKGVMKQKVTVSWSGGKDSAFALYKILSQRVFDVVSLHTVLDDRTGRVGLHGVSEELIEKQAQSIGLPLEKIYLSASENQDQYQDTMQQFYQTCFANGIEGVVFGDIFLEDLKQYRMDLLKPSNLFAHFPLWGINSGTIVREFIDTGFKSAICAADTKLFSVEQLGKTIDHDFLASFGEGIDPCGENGEFHTFVYDGPVFKSTIPIRMGDVVRKTYSFNKRAEDGTIEKMETAFWFQDLIA